MLSSSLQYFTHGCRVVRAHDGSTELPALSAWGQCVPSCCVIAILDFSWPPSVVKKPFERWQNTVDLKKLVSCVPLDSDLAGSR